MNVEVVVIVEDVDEFPSADQAAHDLDEAFLGHRIRKVTVRDSEGVRIDDVWEAR
jgi:hypothetical protein